jgi:hypothetical protein
MIHLIHKKATVKQVEEMLETLGTYIKVAVDIQRKTLVGGGILHADCEAELLTNGSRQEDIWGADWYPKSQKVRFEALINPKNALAFFLLRSDQATLRFSHYLRKTFLVKTKCC